MEKTIFSFALGFQLERASGLGPGCVSTSPFKSRTPCGADPCRPCAHCCNPCESMCASTVLIQRALPPQCLPALLPLKFLHLLFCWAELSVGFLVEASCLGLRVLSSLIARQFCMLSCYGPLYLFSHSCLYCLSAAGLSDHMSLL